MELHKASTGAELLAALKEDHAELEASFRSVLGSARGGDPELFRNAWLSMEDRLRAHMRAEEAFIVPPFERDFSAEAATIRREHDEIRKHLDLLGVALDLHTLNDQAAERFLTALRAHAQREEARLYDWASTALPEGARSKLMSRLRAFQRQAAPSAP